MEINRAVPNIRSDRPAETRDFFVELLGFEAVMDLGWVATVASPTNPSAQVNIIGNDDPAAPGISVEVDDVDAVHARAIEQGLEIAYPLARRGMGSSPLHASRTEWDRCERPLAPLRLTGATQGACRFNIRCSHRGRIRAPARPRPAVRLRRALARPRSVGVE